MPKAHCDPPLAFFLRRGRESRSLPSAWTRYNRSLSSALTAQLWPSSQDFGGGECCSSAALQRTRRPGVDGVDGKLSVLSDVVKEVADVLIFKAGRRGAGRSREEGNFRLGLSWGSDARTQGPVHDAREPKSLHSLRDACRRKRRQKRAPRRGSHCREAGQSRLWWWW